MKKISMTLGRILTATTIVLLLSGCVDSSQPVVAGSAGAAQAGTEPKVEPTPEDETAPVIAQDADSSAPPPVVDHVIGAGSGDPAAAKNDEGDVNLAIDTLLGDHKAYRDVFDRLKAGVAADNRADVAALVDYPISVKMDGKSHKVRSAEEFVASWDKIITPDIAQVITAQRFEDIFVNWRGMMFGDGQVWINGICRDKACSKTDIRVVTIQPASK